MYVLGINSYHGDVSAALLQDGELVAAVEEERFRRVKHWAGFPRESIRKCLEIAGITGDHISHVGVSRNPRAHLARKAWSVLRHRPDPVIVRDRLRNRRKLLSLQEPLAEALGLPADRMPRLHYIEHHPAHLASSFFVSPFEDAAVCAIDGFGDFVSTSFAVGAGNRLRVFGRTFYPHSLGMLYTAVTQYLGFMSFGDEFKVMGLAPYGEPAFVPELRKLVRLLPRGRFELELEYFRHVRERIDMTWEDGYPTMSQIYSPALERLLGPARQPDAPLTPREEAIARSLQEVYEEGAFHVLEELWRRTGNPRLCLAGGCAMNSVANGKVRANTPFQEVYIQPAAADNGTALGAALYVQHQVLGHPRHFVMRHGYWGTEYPRVAPSIPETARPQPGWEYTCERVPDEERLTAQVARLIADGSVVGWFQGRMEWGARALGNRSILADPRRADMRELINTKIKFREKFRPFAPSILEEALDEYFVDGCPDPFMLQVYPVRPEKRAVIPAVTHVDGSGRLQTVSEQTNPLYYRLIRQFYAITGVPVLLNTSFNENEPIVDTPEQALDCFLRTRMDAIVVNQTIIRRQPASVAAAGAAE